MGGKGKEKARRPQKEKGELGAPKGKRENGGKDFCDPIPLGNQTARTYARTHDTTRNAFPVGPTAQPPITHDVIVRSMWH